MGWDYWTYMQQPKFFIEIVTKALQREANQIKKQNGK